MVMLVYLEVVVVFFFFFFLNQGSEDQIYFILATRAASPSSLAVPVHEGQVTLGTRDSLIKEVPSYEVFLKSLCCKVVYCDFQKHGNSASVNSYYEICHCLSIIVMAKTNEP